MVDKLSEFRCVPCRGDAPPLGRAEVDALIPQVTGWELLEVDGVVVLLLSQLRNREPR